MARECLFIISAVLCCVTINTVGSANILFLLPVPSASHRLWNNVLIESLEERGHNLTILTVEDERSRQNVTFICMRNIYESLNEHQDDIEWWSRARKSPFVSIKETYRMANFVSKKIFSSDGVRRLYDYPKSFKFHAVIFDLTLGHSLLAFIEHFDFPPLISVSPSVDVSPSRFVAASSAQIFPSYISHYSTLSTTKSLRESITERFMNAFIYHAFDWFYSKYVYMKNENRRVWGLFGDGNKLKLEQLEYSDLVIINRNFAFDDILPLPPNVIAVAGLQAQRKTAFHNDVSEKKTFLPLR